MLDKLVALVIEPGTPAAQGRGVEAELWSTAAQVQARLRLWDDEGRSPREPALIGERRWLLGEARELPGATLTWWVRLGDDRRGHPPHFELRLRILQNGEPLPGADFYCSGPLDGLDERKGRYRFLKA